MEEFKINLLWSSVMQYAIRETALIFWLAFLQNDIWISGSSVEKFPRSWVLDPKFRVSSPTSGMGLGSRSWVTPKVPGIGSHFSDMLTSNTFDISIRFFSILRPSSKLSRSHDVKVWKIKPKVVFIKKDFVKKK